MEQSYLYTKANKKKLDKWREEIDKEYLQENPFNSLFFLNTLECIDRAVKEYHTIRNCILLNEIKKYLYADEFGESNNFYFDFCEHVELEFIISTCVKKGIDETQRKQIREEIIGELKLCEICDSELNVLVDEVANNLVYIKENHMQNTILFNREKYLLNSAIKRVIPFVNGWWELIVEYFNKLRADNLNKYVELAFSNTFDVISVLSFEVGNKIDYNNLKKELRKRCYLTNEKDWDETFDIIKTRLFCQRDFWLFYVKYTNNELITDVLPDSLKENIIYNPIQRIIWNGFIGRGNLPNQVSMAVNRIFKQHGDIKQKTFWDRNIIFSTAKETLYEILSYEKRYKNEKTQESFEVIKDYRKMKKVYREKRTLLTIETKKVTKKEDELEDEINVMSESIWMNSFFSPVYELYQKKTLKKGMGKNKSYGAYYHKIQNLRKCVTMMESYILEKQTGLILATVVYTNFVGAIGKGIISQQEELICEMVELARKLSNIHNLDIRLNIAMDLMEVVKDILKQDERVSAELLKKLNSVLDEAIITLNNDYDKLLKKMIIEFAPDKKWKKLIDCANMPTTGFKRGLDYLEQLESDMKNNSEMGNGIIFHELLESNVKYKPDQYKLFSRIMESINISVEIE